MSKTTTLPFTQTLKSQYTCFRSSDVLSVYKILPNNNGSNLTTGTRTFTANTDGATIKTGGASASWTSTVVDSRVIGDPIIGAFGDYLIVPTDVTTNAATVDSGNSNATWTLITGVVKTIYTAGSEGSVIKAINVMNQDSASKTVALILTDNVPTFCSIIGTLTVAASSGYPAGTTATIDLLSGTYFPSLPYDNNGKRVLPLQAGHILKAGVQIPAAAKFVDIQVFAEDY